MTDAAKLRELATEAYQHSKEISLGMPGTVGLLVKCSDTIHSLLDRLEAAKRDAKRYHYIKAQMQVGAVQTQLPLDRSVYWVGNHFDCSDVRDVDASIDAALSITHKEGK